MKPGWPRSIVAALGMTTICCFWIVGPLVSPTHDAIYHWSGPAATIFLPAVLDFLITWFFLALLLFVSQGSTRIAATIWACMMLFLPLVACESLFLFMDWHLPRLAGAALLAFWIVSFLLFNCFFHLLPQAAIQRLQRLTSGLLCLVAFGGGLMLVQLAWFGWQARRLNVPQPLHLSTSTSVSSTAGHPRIIWILLDELSYQQVYEHRFPDLQLPAFDELARESTVFTQVQPAGVMTDVALPALIDGMPVDEIHASSTGNSLAVHNPQTMRWQSFDPHDTVFNDALDAGYATALAGWYNPYCRILAAVLDQCYWTFGELSSNRMLSQASLARNIVNPVLLSSSVMNHFPSALASGSPGVSLLATLHIADYKQVSEAAEKLLRNSSLDFIFIHMAVPHPGGIYNRAAHTFATQGSSYIDNLALADAYLAQVRALLMSSGQWDSSAVIIMGDHSWRTKRLWLSRPEWTHEDQVASHGGQFDDRPAYLVKLPGQKQGNRLDLPFAAVNTRLLLDEIMQKQIVSPEDLSGWVSTLHHSESRH